MTRKIETVFVVCPLHSKPGELKSGIIRRGPMPGSVVVLCADCVSMGKEMRARLGIEMAREVASVTAEDLRAKAERGEAPCPTL
jgi:hypothetical protein